MFRDSVRKFASRDRSACARDGRVGAFRKELLTKLFDLGLWPSMSRKSTAGRAEHSFRPSWRSRRLAKVDPSASASSSTCRTRCSINALLRWANDEQKRQLAAALANDAVAAYALSEAGSGSDAFALATRAVEARRRLSSHRPQALDHQRRRSQLFLLFATVNPEAGYKGITAFLVERDFPGFAVGKKEDKLGIRASSTCELILDDCRVPKANVLGEVGKGYKIAIETLNQGRIGIGAQMTGLAEGAFDHAIALRQAAQAVRQANRRFPGSTIRISGDGCRSGGRPPDGLQRGAAERRRAALLTEAAMAKYFASAGGRDGGLASRRGPWRRGLYQGLSGREAVSRRQNRPDLRRHQQHAARDSSPSGYLESNGRPSRVRPLYGDPMLVRAIPRSVFPFSSLRCALSPLRPRPIPARTRSRNHSEVRGRRRPHSPKPAKTTPYRQTAKIQEYDDGGTPGGKFERVGRIVFNADGKRTERPVRAPVPTAPADSDVAGRRGRYAARAAVRADDDGSTNTIIRYSGAQNADEIPCYVFAVKPKKIESGKRYFDGKIWVDDRDLQIVKTYGRGVGIAKKGRISSFPKFETYREQIDGKYWFPTYTTANSTSALQGPTVRIRQTVRYEDYKQFGAESKITVGGEVDPNNPGARRKRNPNSASLWRTQTEHKEVDLVQIRRRGHAGALPSLTEAAC